MIELVDAANGSLAGVAVVKFEAGARLGIAAFEESRVTRVA